uniref:BILF1 n=1 Tax=Pithecia pithecia lymphocryptovirus 1 TaxID=209062 RepID=A0A0A0RZB4_9GAMA|nr:BILF1 [Pithecia pithecia lymphocryptovirus 1]
MDSTTPIMGSPQVRYPDGLGCNSTYSSGLAKFTAATMGLGILFLVLLLIFLIFVRKLQETMDWWLTAIILDTFLWLSGKLFQEFSSTGLCMLTQHMMMMSLLLSGLHHTGMGAHRAMMVSARTMTPIKKRSIICYIFFTFIVVLILVVASVLDAGLFADLNRGPNLCREGATPHGHAARQAAKGFFFLVCCLFTIITTIYITYKLLHTRLSARTRIIINVVCTGTLSALCWLLLAAPLVFRADPGNLGFYCPTVKLTRYYPAFGAILILILLLLYIWAYGKFIKDLKNSAQSTLFTFKRRGSLSI